LTLFTRFTLFTRDTRVAADFVPFVDPLDAGFLGDTFLVATWFTPFPSNRAFVGLNPDPCG
jgi:hypothetical protein